ncbi:hypothetical protein NUSPORA_02300 [Nucleospora cyclopteri]
MQIHFIPIKISIVRITNTFIKRKCFIPTDSHSMCHYAHSMEGWLSIKQYNIIIHKVSLYNVSYFYCSISSVFKKYLLYYFTSTPIHSVSQLFTVFTIISMCSTYYVIGSWIIHSIINQFLQLFQIHSCHSFWYCHFPRYFYRHSYFLYRQIGIRTNYCSP